MMHNLILTRFLVSAKKWTGEMDEFKQVRTCYEVGSDYPSVEVVKEGKKERIKVIPDAWLLFEILKEGEWFPAPILLEIDRETAFKNKFKDHVGSRLEFIKTGGLYSRLFGRREVRIAYVTTGETKAFQESRRWAMCVWTQEVLKEIYDAGVFERAVWYTPDAASPVGLFEK